MKFAVAVMETSWGSVEVEANSQDEAIEKAAEAYRAGNVFWGNSECDFGIEQEATVHD